MANEIKYQILKIPNLKISEIKINLNEQNYVRDA